MAMWRARMGAAAAIDSAPSLKLRSQHNADLDGIAMPVPAAIANREGPMVMA